MILLENPNPWSCGVASLAMLLGRPISVLLAEIGHDGSEIIAPTLKEPFCRRGFNTTELQHVCWNRGRVLAPFDLDPTNEGFHIYKEEELETRMFDLINSRPGLLEGGYSHDRPHIVAWTGSEVYDPLGPRRYSFSDDCTKINIATFWLLV